MLRLVCIQLALIVCATALKLPTYIKPCYQEEPDLNNCVLKAGRAAIPEFIHGDRKYRIPDLDPLVIYNFEVEQGTRQVGLAIKMKEAKIFGLPEARFENARVDLKKRHIEWDFFTPKINIQGIYDVNGRVLILPIRGHGPANITLTDCTYNYTFDFDLAKNNVTGKDHMILKNENLKKFDASKFYINLENLFDGNKLLGDNMNQFLNENWREILKEVGPAITDAIATVFNTILSEISELVPYEFAYLPGKPPKK